MLNANLRYTGAGGAVGSFTGGFSATGLGSGIILSSGGVTTINGTNTFPSAGVPNGLLGDADLQQQLPPGSVTNDAAVLEFDFVVTEENATTVKFDYVFASEEYQRVRELAVQRRLRVLHQRPRVPDADEPGAGAEHDHPGDDQQRQRRQSVRRGEREQSGQNYINDSPGVLGTQADGLTKVFSISADITPNVVYHLKIAIADVADSAYDSWVMLKAGSFGAVCPIIPNCPSCGLN